MSLFKAVRNTNPTTTDVGYDYLYLPLYGQSLTTNQTGGKGTPNVTYSRTFSDGLLGEPNGSSTLIALPSSNYTIVAMHNMIIDKRGVSDDAILVSNATGGAGRTCAQLSKDTSYYNKTLASVTALKRIADSEGKTMNVPAIAYGQGEAESLLGSDLYFYQAQLEQLIADFNTDIKAITGQTNDVKLCIYQVATARDKGRFHVIANQHLQAAIDNPNILLSKAMYVADYEPDPDEIHGLVQTYGLMGAKYGYQIWNEILNGNSKPVFSVKTHTYNALKSTIVFNVPYEPLAFDATDVTALSDGNKGFNLFDMYEDTANMANNTISKPTPTITNVQITASDTVEITYSADPTGYTLTYAMEGVGWEQVTGTDDLADTGRVSGARGLLRDNQGAFVEMDILDAFDLVQFSKIYNYCPMFQIDLT